MDKGCRLDPTSQLNFHALIDQGEIKTWDVLMSIFRCACCCGPRERWSVDAWLWHPDNDELCCSLLCQCMLLVLSQISVHYAFINDPVVLVSTGFEMEHFKHGEYWVEVFCQTTFVPDEASSPIPTNAQTSANVWERAAEPVWVHSFEFENSNMTGYEHALTTKRPCCNMMYIMCTCLMHANQVDPLFRNWQSDCCHSIAWMKYIWSKGVENVVPAAFYFCSLVFLIRQVWLFDRSWYVAICDDLPRIGTIDNATPAGEIFFLTTINKNKQKLQSNLTPLLIQSWLSGFEFRTWSLLLALSRCDRHPRLKPYRSSCDSLATSTKDAAAGTHGIGQWCGRCQSDHCVKGIRGEHLLPATFRALAGVCGISNIMEWNQPSSELAIVQRCLEVG